MTAGSYLRIPCSHDPPPRYRLSSRRPSGGRDHVPDLVTMPAGTPRRPPAPNEGVMIVSGDVM